MFSYLKSKSNSKLVFDLKEPNMGTSDFVECDLSGLCPGTQEVIPPKTTNYFGKDATLQKFVDSNPTVDKVRHHLRTGFVIFLNYYMVD